MSELIEVDFRPKDGEADDVGLRIKKRKWDDCKHERTIVNEDLRRVDCRSCGAQLDPIEVILHWAREWERYANAVKGLRGEMARRQKEIEELRVEAANLKAQIRRAKKNPALPRGEGE